MDKLNFDIHQHDEFIKQKQELIAQLSNDPLIVRWAALNNIKNDEYAKVINNNIFKLKQYKDEVTPCTVCDGLHMCCKNPKGMIRSLSYNGAFVQENLVACNYKKEENIKYAFLKQFIYNDFTHLKDAKQSDLLVLEKHGTKGKRALNQLVSFIQQPSKGLFIYGELGSGKTYTCAIIANEFAKQGKRVAFINLNRMISRVKQSLKIIDNSLDDYISDLSRVEIAIFDDIGADNNTAWVRDELLFTVLNERMNRGLLTLFTSNFDYDTLEKHFMFNNNGSEEALKAKRLIERIKTLTSPVLLTGQNLRVLAQQEML